MNLRLLGLAEPTPPRLGAQPLGTELTCGDVLGAAGLLWLLVFILNLLKERRASVTFPSNFGASGFLNVELKTEKAFITDLKPF